MNYNSIRKTDISNGPGVRVSIFLQGCSIRCKGCFNSELWDFNGGKPFTNETLNTLIELVDKEYISGLSILGGEPLSLQNIPLLGTIISKIKESTGKSIWVYTGYIWENLSDQQKNILKHADVLVDGPYIEKLQDISLKFRGSSNQRIIDIQQSLINNNVVKYDA